MWLVPLIVCGSLLLIWILLNAKKSRKDGTFITNIPKYRKMLCYIMPERNGSVVYFDDYVNCEKLLAYIAEAREQFHVDITHCLVAAGNIGLAEVPQMNRFVIGKRLYQRKVRHIAFSAKRKKKDKKAKLAAVKLEGKDGETFRDMVKRIADRIDVERSDAVTYSDKELGLLTKIPRPLLAAGVKFLQWLDYHNMLPASFIDNDAFYTSIFIANLGSVGMRAGFHHLYEWGNCPLFLMVGKIEDRPVVEDGEVKVQKTLHIRYTYDERIDDGLTASFGITAVRKALENPYEYFGCLKDDGSDARPLDQEAGKEA